MKNKQKITKELRQRCVRIEVASFSLGLHNQCGIPYKVFKKEH